MKRVYASDHIGYNDDFTMWKYGNDKNATTMIDGHPHGIPTKVIIRDKKTKRILFIGQNRTLLSASEFFALRMFSFSSDVKFLTQSYNQENPNIDNDIEQNTESNQDLGSNYKINLFCMGNSGCQLGSFTKLETIKQGRIPLASMVPFRYVASNNDLSADERLIYFGRLKESDDHIAYYFKSFQGENHNITRQYDDNTNWETNVYEEFSTSNKNNLRTPNVKVSTTLTINSTDGREYYKAKDQFNVARFNCFSLLFSWTNVYNGYIYHHDVRAATRINISDKSLTETSSYEIIYSMYF